MPPHFPLTLHLTPLILSPSHGRPSGLVRDTSPPFLQENPLHLSFLHSLHKIPIIFIHFLLQITLFSSTSTREELSPKIPLLPPPNPNPKNSPKLFHLHLKTSRIHQGLQQGLHLQPPTPKATPRSTPSTQASTTWWIEAIFSSIGSSFKLNPSK